MNMMLGLHSQTGRCPLCMLSGTEVQGCKPWSNVHSAPGEPLARVPAGLQHLKEGVRQPGGKQLHHDSQQMDAVKLGCFMAAGHSGFGLTRALEDCYLPGKGNTAELFCQFACVMCATCFDGVHEQCRTHCYLPGKGKTLLGISANLHASHTCFDSVHEQTACKVQEIQQHSRACLDCLIACCSVESIAGNPLLETAELHTIQTKIATQGCTMVLCCIHKGAAQHVYGGLRACLTTAHDLPPCLWNSCTICVERLVCMFHNVV